MSTKSLVALDRGTPHERHQVGVPLAAVDIGASDADALDLDLLVARRLRVGHQLRVLARQQERRRRLAVHRHHPG